ncbi:hypothetical protein TRVL_06231 [Trypanosoma vivax]|nr:hypothetical protein TRVL_06231 [Trypanosoma vivax]
MNPTSATEAVVAFDCEGVVVCELSFERRKPTQWLLLSFVPIDVAPARLLHFAESHDSSFRSSALPPVADTFHSGSCADGGHEFPGLPLEARGCIRMARVGHMPEKSGTYCLLLNCTTSGIAELLRSRFSEVSVSEGGWGVPEFVRSVASTTHYSQGCQASARSGGRSRGSNGSKGVAKMVIKLEVLCRLPCAFEGRGSCQSHRSLDCVDIETMRSSAPRVPVKDLCSICREEIVSEKPYVLTVCGHVFHLLCFSQHFTDASSRCPLCRFSMSSLDSKCNACGTYQNLWTCLVCGWVGCGQGQQNDSLLHFNNTGHSCAVENTTSRIWSFSFNTFLHHQLAMELGQRADVKAATTAESTGQQCDSVDTKMRPHSSCRMEWCWSEKDEEEGELEPDDEYMQKFYLDIKEQLKEEQAKYYQSLPTTTGNSVFSIQARQLELSVSEREGRSGVVSDYVSDMLRIAREEQAVLKELLKREASRNVILNDDLLLHSHTVKNLEGEVARLESEVEKMAQRSARQVAAKKDELERLQNKLIEVMGRLN